MRAPSPPLAPSSRTPDFGALLKALRGARGRSQLDLSTDAGVSARHLSFLETGRAQPSRAMVGALCRALGLDLAARNALHLSAGYAAPHAARELGDADVTPVRQAFAFILAQQEPYPALVVDARWDVRLRNRAAERLFGPFRAAYDMPARLAGNAMHVVFHPRGLKPFVEGWDAFAGALSDLLHRDALAGSAEARALADEIADYPAPDPALATAGRRNGVAPMTVALGGTRLSFFTTLTSLALPDDAALQRLRAECFFPADEATAEAAARAAALETGS